MTAAGEDRREVLEEYFVRSGMPHLAAAYDPREDTLTRLRPILVVLFVVTLALTLRPDWPWWAQILGALAGLAVVVALLVMLNLARGLPAFARPTRVGFGEAAAFVVAPAIADLALGDRGLRPLWIALGSLAVAVVLYALLSLGIVSMVLNLGRAAVEGLAATAGVALRAMPPVLAVLLFLFLATEVWQAFGLLEGWRFGSVLIVFALLGTVFLVIVLRGEMREITSPPADEATRARALATPAAPLVEEGVTPSAPPLGRMARLNVLVAMVVAIGGRVIAVGVSIGLFFMLFGVLVVDESLTETWTGQPANVLLSLTVSGRTVVVTEELVRVSTLLGGFAALYFVVVALTEKARREDFLDDEIERVSRVMAAWTYYRGLVDGDGAPGRPDPGSTGILPRP